MKTISSSAFIKRLGRNLYKDGLRLRVARNATEGLGPFFTINDDCIVEHRNLTWDILLNWGVQSGVIRAREDVSDAERSIRNQTTDIKTIVDEMTAKRFADSDVHLGIRMSMLDALNDLESAIALSRKLIALTESEDMEEKSVILQFALIDQMKETISNMSAINLDCLSEIRDRNKMAA